MDISVTVFARVRVCVWVCTVTDFSAGDKASRVKFCMLVHLRPGQGISHFGELCSPDAQNRTNRPTTGSKVYYGKAHRKRHTVRGISRGMWT